MKKTLIIIFAASIILSGCGTSKTPQASTPSPTKLNQQGSPQTNSTSTLTSSNNSKESNNKSNGSTPEPSTPTTKTISSEIHSTTSTTTSSAGLQASFVSPKPYSWVPNKDLTVSWTVNNTTGKDVAFNLVLTDLTDSRNTYQTDLNLNSNFPSAKMQNGVYSWNIPATYINSQGYTLQDKHQYKLTLYTYIKWDKQGLCPYKPVYCYNQFSVDNSKANIGAPVGNLGVSLTFVQTGRSFDFKVYVTAGGKPLPDAQVSVNLHSTTQTYLQNLVSQTNGVAEFYSGIFDNNPLTANVTVKAVGQTATANGTYSIK